MQYLNPYLTTLDPSAESILALWKQWPREKACVVSLGSLGGAQSGYLPAAWIAEVYSRRCAHNQAVLRQRRHRTFSSAIFLPEEKD